MSPVGGEESVVRRMKDCERRTVILNPKADSPCCITPRLAQSHSRSDTAIYAVLRLHQQISCVWKAVLDVLT